MKRDGSDTRQAILDAAAQTLGREGYAGTRLSDIAAIVGISTPAIYRHFPSREDLVATVMTVGHQSFIQQFADVMEQAPRDATPMQKILDAVAGHLRVILTTSHYAAATNRNMNQMPEAVRQQQRELRREYGRMWRELFRDAQAAGEISADLDLRVAQGFVIGAMGWTVEWWNPEQRSFDKLVESTQALVENALTAPSASLAR